jgi:predicted ArsR family transcriptional regulator
VSDLSDEGAETLLVIGLHADPVVTAPELAEQLNISPQAVNKRLDTLEQDQFVTSKKVGASAKVYWLTEAGEREVSNIGLRWL